MKKVFYLMLCMIVGLSATSCLSDDDDDNITYTLLTPQDKASQLTAMAGAYNGWIYYVNDTTNKTDSTTVTWRVTASDSVLTINNFPIKILANGISNPEARKILMAGSTEPITAIAHPYANTSKNTGYYTFWIFPTDFKAEFTTEYGGTNHDVTVNFTDQMTAYAYGYGATSLYYAYGEYMENKMLAYFLIKSIEVDKNTYSTGWATLIYGKK